MMKGIKGVSKRDILANLREVEAELVDFKFRNNILVILTALAYVVVAFMGLTLL